MLRCRWLCERVSGSGCMWTGLRWCRPSWCLPTPSPPLCSDWIPGSVLGRADLCGREAGEVMLIMAQAGHGEHAGHGGHTGG